MSEEVLFEVRDRIAWITLNRPQAGNAVTATMGDAIAALWARVREDDGISVAIVTGSGERHFSTGAAVEALSSKPADRSMEEALRYCPLRNNVWKPVICLVNGLVAGGGLHFVVEADIVVAHAGVTFTDPHVSVGQVAGIEPIGLMRRIGPGPALRMALLGRHYRMTAEEAHTLGLVDALAPTLAEARAVAEDFAGKLLRNSPSAMALTKRAIWEAESHHYERALLAAYDLINRQRLHPDSAEGPRAFMEKRDPQWNPDPDARR